MLVTIHFAKRIKGVNVGARLIEWAQDTNFSHTAIELLETPEGESWVFESVYPKSRRLAKKDWIKKYESVESYSFIIDDPKVRYEMRETLYKNLNVPYSIGQIILIGVGLAIKMIEKLINKITLNAKKYMICSEYSSEALFVLGAQFKDSSDLIDLLDCRDEARKLKGLK
jgi:hydrogenase maturation factor